MKTHELPLRVYYEDTDMGEVVYYANYLRFMERGRTEYLRDLGFNQLEMKHKLGLVFVVRKVEADYLKPSFYDDELVVRTSIQEIRRASFSMRQEIYKKGELIFYATVVLVAIDRNLKPMKLPDDLVQALEVSNG